MLPLLLPTIWVSLTCHEELEKEDLLEDLCYIIIPETLLFLCKLLYLGANRGLDLMIWVKAGKIHKTCNIVYPHCIHRSGSIASSTVNWRKGSVTIPEKSEDGEEEDETTNCSVAVRIDDGRPRRLSESTPVKSA